MLKFAKSIIFPVAALLFLISPAGAERPPQAAYLVKSYSSGKIESAFTASSYRVKRDGSIEAIPTGGVLKTIGGTFSVRILNSDNRINTAVATSRAELYSAGKAVETVETAFISGLDGVLGMRECQTSTYIVFGGTYVVRKIGADLEGNPDAARFKVTAYRDGLEIGIWYADSISHYRDSGISLKVSGINDAIIFNAGYSIELLR